MRNCCTRLQHNYKSGSTPKGLLGSLLGIWSQTTTMIFWRLLKNFYWSRKSVEWLPLAKDFTSSLDSFGFHQFADFPRSHTGFNLLLWSQPLQLYCWQTTYGPFPYSHFSVTLPIQPLLIDSPPKASLTHPSSDFTPILLTTLSSSRSNPSLHSPQQPSVQIQTQILSVQNRLFGVTPLVRVYFYSISWIIIIHSYRV